jgi:hypothetical protein
MTRMTSMSVSIPSDELAGAPDGIGTLKVNVYKGVKGVMNVEVIVRL